MGACRGAGLPGPLFWVLEGNRLVPERGTGMPLGAQPLCPTRTLGLLVFGAQVSCPCVPLGRREEESGTARAVWYRCHLGSSRVGRKQRAPHPPTVRWWHLSLPRSISCVWGGSCSTSSSQVSLVSQLPTSEFLPLSACTAPPGGGFLSPLCMEVCHPPYWALGVSQCPLARWVSQAAAAWKLCPGDGPRFPVLTDLHSAQHLQLQLQSRLAALRLPVRPPSTASSSGFSQRDLSGTSADPIAAMVTPLRTSSPGSKSQNRQRVTQRALSPSRPQSAKLFSPLAPQSRRSGLCLSQLKAERLRDFVEQPPGFQNYEAESNGNTESVINPYLHWEIVAWPLSELNKLKTTF